MTESSDAPDYLASTGKATATPGRLRQLDSSAPAATTPKAIADLERTAREANDAVLRRASGAAADFVAILWFYLADEEAHGIDPDQVDLDAFIDELLAAAQTPEHVPTFSAVAHTVQRQYMRTDPTARRRWPRTGTSIGSAQIIDARARQLATLISQQDTPEVDPLNRAGPALELLARTARSMPCSRCPKTPLNGASGPRLKEQASRSPYPPSSPTG
ncbi:hypothetical protein GCM10023195_01690 [Actinoallomurus liliacearum]|uniref:Uncharacterized protein n=1 Tax=Actinoallomurus liliacearum TaxID=1080073 RepID=A0ABP8TCJ9_9ACTN